MKITREIDPNELIISHRFTYQANGRIIGLRRVPEASNILCLRHGSSVWILVCSSYGHFCCSGCSSPVDFGMSVNCYGFFLQTINGSSECTCWSKKNHGHISESCSQRLRGDEQHSLLIIRLILSCPPICRAQREVLPSNMRHEFVHYNNTNQDQQSDSLERGGAILRKNWVLNLPLSVSFPCRLKNSVELNNWNLHWFTVP